MDDAEHKRMVRLLEEKGDIERMSRFFESKPWEQNTRLKMAKTSLEAELQNYYMKYEFMIRVSLQPKWDMLSKRNSEGTNE